jgi:hypothetical protein
VVSAIKPIPHGPDIPIPKPPDNVSFSTSTDESSEGESSSETYHDEKQPKPLTQTELNDLTRDLGLSKESSQLLGSRLRENNLLAPGTTFYWYRERGKDLRQFFTKNEEASLVCCNNISGLIKEMGLACDPTERRLFIDSSCHSLKAVLLNIGNKFACVPVGHSVQMSETYGDMEILLHSLDYKNHEWLICGDLKVR